MFPGVVFLADVGFFGVVGVEIAPQQAGCALALAATRTAVMIYEQVGLGSSNPKSSSLTVDVDV